MHVFEGAIFDDYHSPIKKQHSKITNEYSALPNSEAYSRFVHTQEKEKNICPLFLIFSKISCKGGGECRFFKDFL